MKLSSIAKSFFVRVINTESLRIVTFLALYLIMTITPVMAQDGSVRPSRSEARAAWERGDFDLAYEHYNGLLLLYSRDPVYKYYTGASLVKLERDLPRAVTLLGSAINSSVNVKSVPDDVWFYYGRALQMTGSFTQASEAYDRFTREAGRKVATGYGVQDYMDQCDKRQGAVKEEKSAIPETQIAESKENEMAVTTPAKPEVQIAESKENELAVTTPAKPEAQIAESKENKMAVTTPAKSEAQIAESKENKMAVTTPKAEVAKQETATNVIKTPEISGEKASGGYEQAMEKAVRVQSSADSLARIAENAASAMEEAPPGQRAAMESRASEARIRAEAMQSEADSLFLILEEKESTVPEKTTSEPAQPTPAHQLSMYELRASPAYSEKNPVPVDIAMPPGLIYTIQIAAFRNAVSPSLFKGLYPVFGRKRPESEATYYYAGIFRRLDDARQALPEVRSTGFPDAFIIALMDGTQVSMERAQALGKEWSDKPLPGTGAGSVSTVQSEARDEPSAPMATLSFRAEVMRISKPVKPEVIEKLEMLAGTRGLDQIKNSSGETVFLIGNFITFESAGEYVSLLIRNGYGSARVAAYVGMHEIPVEAALELLNRLQDD